MISQIKRQGLVIAVLCLLVAIAWFAGPFASRNAAAAPDKPSVQWEYCCLEYRHGKLGSLVLTIDNAKEKISAQGWCELAQQLKVYVGDKEANNDDPEILKGWKAEAVARRQVFDYLGGQGWELVSVLPREKGDPAEATYIFKRRIEGRGDK
jgi:hypothetical protein